MSDWRVGDVGTHMLVPRGQEFIPPGWLLCDGRCYMRDDYPDLWQIFKTNRLTSDPPDSFRVTNQAPVISSDSVVQLVVRARPLAS